MGCLRLTRVVRFGGSMLSKWAYILIGNDQTGKTTFQKALIKELCGYEISRLDVNLIHNINHPDSPRKLKTLSTMNRSYQEKIDLYGSVEEFFEKHFKDADVCILSSHITGHADEIKAMIKQLHLRRYNVGAIYWSNAPTDEKIDNFRWDERFEFNNPISEDKDEIIKKIRELAYKFSRLIVTRSYHQ